MKKIFILILLFVTTLNFSQIIGPVISVNKMTHDFGDIEEGGIVEYDFIITNSGGDLLTIKGVNASCGCTAAKPNKNELEPNESSYIHVEFNTSHRNGQQKKYVYVKSNDPKNPELRLCFTANIVPKGTLNIDRPKISLSKYQHDFGTVQKGDNIELEIEIFNKGTKNLTISDIMTSSKYVNVIFQNPTIEPENSAKMTVQFDTSEKIGKIIRTVNILSNDPLNSQLTLTLIINIVDRS
ncbi:MAG: DUF1573 domain-containing protein [Ignavibacteriales bacterium]|nr:DUF1573 domain-containing protein [Ignavibacteriales bacterium]